ncbi:hypothetical protein K466DRAFT_520245 [Polyporus arcularius HHB13444]|uniref:DUF6535 domain-containing protein n=1 Tax=Polyporus arcularius HHB13444 TaxID=1314778 RepID=A0A5C3PG69_9APHY|nr:hypothetical protein K466DRAFT_520245 [Polyporus arcularius HHB13444]
MSEVPRTRQTPVQAKDERPKWETAKTLEDYWEERKTFFNEEDHAKAWKETARIVEEESNDMVDRLNKEIDALLTYAGLFSAIQTAFNIELYKRLSDPDPVLVALGMMSAQLSSFTVNRALVNSTGPTFVFNQSIPAAVPLWIVVVNALWFSSLISSLSAAFIGIMAKQWLTQYKSGVSGTERHTARLRQLRLNSLKRWRVEEIVGVVPVLLQLASGLFFAGLLVLLWNLNRTVAIVGSIFVGFLAVFSLSTIILPSIVMHCSYLSPPSRVLFELTRPCRRALCYFCGQLSLWIAYRCDFRRATPHGNSAVDYHVSYSLDPKGTPDAGRVIHQLL